MLKAYACLSRPVRFEASGLFFGTKRIKQSVSLDFVQYFEPFRNIADACNVKDRWKSSAMTQLQ